jgi:hypothetical protein
MQKSCFVSLALAGAWFVALPIHAQFADTVVAYDRGTGFAANFTNSSAALGAPAASASVTPFAPPFSTAQIVSVGAGGSLTLQFNTPISDNPANPFGLDFLIFGNSFFVSSGGTASGAIFTSSMSTRVEVSPDNLTWYVLNPALAPTVGTLFPTDGPGNPFQPVNPALTAGDFTGLNLAGIRALYDGSAGGAGFDLAWAQDTLGNGVSLSGINFLRIDVLSGRTQIDAIVAVPEPSVFGLLMLPALLGLRRISKNSKPKTQIKP